MVSRKFHKVSCRAQVDGGGGLCTRGSTTVQRKG